MSQHILTCTPKFLPREQIVAAAERAININPLNYAPLHRLSTFFPGFRPTREQFAVSTTQYWHTDGVHLTVSFLESTPMDLQTRILSHMNAWGSHCNVQFALSRTDPQVRISRETEGYWSYLGTDILQVPADQPTMSLQGFSTATPESEYHRVVRHQTGHTLGCPHERLRRELVDKIDPDKAIAYYAVTCGWSADQTRQQVLTPSEEPSLWDHDDPNSIMCHQIPGLITRDGQAIPGGLDIDEQDFELMAKVYPLALTAKASDDASELEQLQVDNLILRRALAIFARSQD